MSKKIKISAECAEEFLIGYPVDEEYIARRAIPGNDLIVEIVGSEVIAVYKNEVMG